MSWKQLYFERNLVNALERYDPQTTELNALKRLCAFSKRFVRALHISQLPSHLDLQVQQNLVLHEIQKSKYGITLGLYAEPPSLYLGVHFLLVSCS